MNDVKLRPVRKDELRKYKNICTVMGSTKYDNYEVFGIMMTNFIRDHHFDQEDTVFVCGMDKGVGTMLIKWCTDNEWKYHECPVKWNGLNSTGAVIKRRKDGTEYNSAAPYSRNQEAANISKFALIFFDGKDKIDSDLIEKCAEKNIRFRVITVKA